jgi:DMSO/TMAO reductase YedYZ molybdopterin-dependent catalytic subunit
LECVGNTAAGEFISTAEWKGVSLRTLLDEAGANVDAYDVVFKAADEFVEGMPGGEHRANGALHRIAIMETGCPSAGHGKTPE